MSTEKLLISQQDSIFLVSTNEIIFLKSDNCYTTIHTKGGKSIFVSKSLSKFQKELEADHFIRVNQSFLVNKHFIQYVNKKKKHLVLDDNSVIPFTVSLRELLVQLKTA